jgi:hypothetical protein
MRHTNWLVGAATLILYFSAHAADPGQNSAPANGTVASGSFPKHLVLEWYLETPETQNHLYKEIGLSPDGEFMYVADVWEDAVLIFRTDDPATPIGSFTDPVWGKTGVFPYGLDVGMDGMVYASTFDNDGDYSNDNWLVRWDPIGGAVIRLCVLPEPVRGLQVSGAGLNTVVYASGNSGSIMRCSPGSSGVFAVETLFSTGVFRNQQDVVARKGGKELYVSTWSHERRDWYPDGPIWTPYESMVTCWDDQGHRDTRFSVSYLPHGNVPAMVLNRQMNRLYCFHLGIGVDDFGRNIPGEACIYKINPINGKLVDFAAIAGSGTGGGGGIDMDTRGDIYLSWSVEIRNGFRISALAKVRDVTVEEDAQHSVEALFAGDQGNVVVTPSRPSDFALEQNYPNPFNPTTTIRYGLPGPSHVTLTVVNALGQVVATLVGENQDAGYHEVRFDGSALPSGVYIYRLQADGFVQTRKLLLLK